MKNIFKCIVCLFIFVAVNSFAIDQNPTNASMVNQSIEQAPITSATPATIAPEDISSRLAALENSSSILQNKIDSLQEQFNSMAATMQQLGQNQNISFIKWLETNISISYFIIISSTIILALVLLIILHIFTLKNIRSKTSTLEVEKKKSDVASDDDFDLMSAKEGMPAKLNLARAYIDMGDNEKATKLLQEVVASGDQTLQNEAQILFKKIQ